MSTAEFFRPAGPVPVAGEKGSLNLLQRLSLMGRVIRNPLDGWAAYQYDAPYDQYRFFNRSFTLLNDPALIRAVHVDHAASLRHEFVRQAMLRPALRDGLLTAEGEKWKRTRRALAPIFSPRHIAGFGTSMHRTAERFAGTVKPSGSPQRVAPMMSSLAYEILSDSLFSGELAEHSQSMLADVDRFLTSLGTPDPADLFVLPGWVPRLTRLRGRGSIARLRAVVRQLAQARRASIASGKPSPQDFLTLLLGAGEDGGAALGDDEIEDNILTFIGAGHETTARTLGWLLYLLAHDEHWRQQVEEEVDALDINLPPEQWGDALPLTRACIDESLRLFPPAALIARRASQEIAVKEVVIPANTTVFINAWILHRHHLLWDNPDAFDPRRFLPQNRDTIDRFAYLPFGVGPRVCIGASFALQEAVIMAATLLRRFRFDYAASEPAMPVMRITVHPHNGLPMRITAR